MMLQTRYQQLETIKTHYSRNLALNTEAFHDNQLITESYVDQLHQENERPRRDLGSVFYN